nr:unnamed protein product [Digitaria exilis]
MEPAAWLERKPAKMLRPPPQLALVRQRKQQSTRCARREETENDGVRVGRAHTKGGPRTSANATTVDRTTNAAQTATNVRRSEADCRGEVLGSHGYASGGGITQLSPLKYTRLGNAQPFWKVNVEGSFLNRSSD